MQIICRYYERSEIPHYFSVFYRFIPGKECVFCAINPFYMKKTLTLLFTFLSLFILSSCEKDEDPVIKTKTELITSFTWKFGTATVGGTDVSASLPTCQKDNIMTFTTAGTGTVDEGPTKCNAGDPQTNPFTWSFATNETVLNISTILFTGGSNTFNIIALNESQLVLSQTITVGGTPQNAVVTFLH